MSTNSSVPVLDRECIALAIRQPWAELILRGLKTIEVRTLTTQHRGPISIYSSKTLATHDAALQAIREHQLDAESLPRGKIVGSVEILDCQPLVLADHVHACLPREFLNAALHSSPHFGWQLADPQRLTTPKAPAFLPYGVWFYPFRRRG